MKMWMRQRLAQQRIWRQAAMVAVTALMGIQWVPMACAKGPEKPDPNWQLKHGLKQALTPKERALVDLNEKRQAASARADVHPLSRIEMSQMRGRGVYRNKYFDGTLPWQRSLRDVNLCDGNLFKSFTDIQVAPARGAGLALQRTYNSDDDRIGPFGVGWTHAYDIRMEEEGGGSNLADRTDFFGGKHKYHRDADGLYSPPVYLFDQLNSDYNNSLVNGPASVQDDTQTGEDGTTKHFIANGSERDCDWIQDRYGNRTNLTYGLNVTLGDGTTKNLLTQVTDPSGRSLTFTWTNLGTTPAPAWRITQVAGPQYSVTYSYGGDFNLSSVTLDPGASPHLNRTTTYTYTSVSGPNGSENGLLASITDPLGHAVSYQYSLPANDPTGTVWVTQVNEPGSGGTHSFTITPQYTSPTYETEVLDNDGLRFLILSDAQLRVTCTSTGSNPSPFFVSYDASNNVVSSNRSNDNGYRPPPGSPYLIPAPEQWWPEVIDNFTYGPHGNVLTHTIQGFTGTETTSYYNADKYFQKASFTDMNGHTTNWDYYSITDPNPGNRGNVKLVQDARYATTGKQFTYTYNSYGQKASEVNLNGVETDYTYGDPWGNLTQVVQDPGTGHLNRTTSMVYDIAGHVLQSTDPLGQTDAFTYNNLGQPATASFPANSSAAAETVSYTYGGNGRTDSMTDNRGTTTLAYETGDDRVSSVTDPVTGTTGYTYGIGGERQTMTLPGGGTWTYRLGAEIEPKDDPNSFALAPQEIQDDQGRLVDFGFGLHGEVSQVISNKVYSGGGALQSYCEADYYPEGCPFGVAATPGAPGLLKEVENRYAHLVNGAWVSSVLSDNVYSMDTAGNRVSNQVTDNTGTIRTEQYGYDELNRLTSVNYGDGQTQTYSFDPMGNRLQKADSVSGTENYTVNAANMLLTRGSNAYTNDADGNTLSGGGRTSSWDSQNRMVQCVNGSNTSNYVYGADGLRHRSTVNGMTTDFALDGQCVVRELRAGTSYATYLTGASGPMYKLQNTNGTIRWYLYDGLGSVLGEVDPSGNVTTYAKYDVYGGVRSRTGTATSAHGFVGALGHTSEAETGLIYMRARYMDPATGRFVSEDPIANGVNWFEYAENCPTCLIDPDGRSVKDAVKFDIDAVLGDLLHFALGLLGSGLGQLWAGAKLKKAGEGEEGQADSMGGNLLGSVLQMYEKVDGVLKQVRGGQMLIGGFRKTLLGAVLLLTVQCLAAMDDVTADDISKAIGGL